MGVRDALLALVAERPRHGYELKLEFERRTGGAWPLNVGQVYQALRRLERDGLVVRLLRRADGTIRYVATVPGEESARLWRVAGVERPTAVRDELAVKLLLAATGAEVDVLELLVAQREVTARRLQDLAQRTRAAVARGEHARALALERLLVEAEAEARWLDRAEAWAPTAAGTPHAGAAQSVR